jgi:hypothetical protein
MVRLHLAASLRVPGGSNRKCRVPVLGRWGHVLVVNVSAAGLPATSIEDS